MARLQLNTSPHRLRTAPLPPWKTIHDRQEETDNGRVGIGFSLRDSGFTARLQHMDDPSTLGAKRQNSGKKSKDEMSKPFKWFPNGIYGERALCLYVASTGASFTDGH